ncbi:unnamed protein product, partial [Aphanomyces euteiches]
PHPANLKGAQWADTHLDKHRQVAFGVGSPKEPNLDKYGRVINRAKGKKSPLGPKQA